MLESQHPRSHYTSGFARALLLRQESPTADDEALAKLLDFFGIPWDAATADGIGALTTDRDGSDVCIVSSAPCLAEAMRNAKDSCDSLPGWMLEAHSVYIYGLQDTELCRQLLRFLTRDPYGGIRKLEVRQTLMSISSDDPEMCGPLSGIQVLADSSEGDLVFDIAHHGEGFRSLIRASGGDFFFAVICRGVPFYLSGAQSIIDISSDSPKPFDVRTHFSSSVPPVMYLQWAFPNTCWSTPETGACLIIDDPPLKPRYGFLRFHDALELMDEHNFTTAIGFIPWNWRRTNSRTVAIFQQRPDRFSLCIHGSDHTASELASRSTAQLNRTIKTACQRMELLLQRTTLQHVRVMVFPQGAFSPEAGRVLKLNGFVAAVNTEVAPSASATNQTTIADLWSIAIMKYGTFPLFTRRYMTHGIENFAFDGLLGKPCLMVGHHDTFKSHGRELVDFITKLNSLNWDLHWRPLGDALSHSFRVRTATDGTRCVQMFTETLAIENPSRESLELVFVKEEGDPDCVKAAMVNQNAVDFGHDGKYLRWRVTLAPNETSDVRVVYFDNLDVGPSKVGIQHKIKVTGRRYLSEFRDNVLSQNDFFYGCAAKVIRLLR